MEDIAAPTVQGMKEREILKVFKNLIHRNKGAKTPAVGFL